MYFSNTQEQDMTGTGGAGEEVTVARGYTRTQVTISGRSSGNVAIKVKGFGGDFFEDADPAISLNLATERTAVFEDVIDALEFTADTTGTYTVHILQTLST